jgi:hypothetical protein
MRSSGAITVQSRTPFTARYTPGRCGEWRTEAGGLCRAASHKGADLGRRLSRALGVPRGGNPSFYAGTSFYNSSNRALIATSGVVKGLRPADIILFRAKDLYKNLF